MDATQLFGFPVATIEEERPFQDARGFLKVHPPSGSDVCCAHCNTTAFQIINDAVVVISRHHGQSHKTVVPLKALGFVRIA